jgi:hypothetical protein
MPSHLHEALAAKMRAIPHIQVLEPRPGSIHEFEGVLGVVNIYLLSHGLEETCILILTVTSAPAPEEPLLELLFQGYREKGSHIFVTRLDREDIQYWMKPVHTIIDAIDQVISPSTIDRIIAGQPRGETTDESTLYDARRTAEFLALMAQ